MPSIAEKKKVVHDLPLSLQKGRLSVWKKIYGLWKNSKPDPIRELGKMRKEWDRKLPV